MPARGDEAPPNLYVVARFLDALVEGPKTRTQLQTAVGVNYDILRRYLEQLQARGLLTLDETGTARATSEGRRVRRELRAWIQRFLDPETIPPPPQNLKDESESAAPP